MLAIIVNFFFHLLGHDSNRRADSAAQSLGLNLSLANQIDAELAQLEVDLSGAVDVDDTREVYRLLARRDSLDRQKLAAKFAAADSNYELVHAQ